MSIVTDEAEDTQTVRTTTAARSSEGAFHRRRRDHRSVRRRTTRAFHRRRSEAAADFFTSHLSMLGSASSFIDTGRAKDLARGMLDAARKAINRPATSQIQRTSMGLSGHMEYRHTMK